MYLRFFFFFSSRRRHTRLQGDWSSDVCSSDLFNAVSSPGAFTMGKLISSSQNATPKAGTTVTWVSEDFLAAHWKADELDLPPWSPMRGTRRAHRPPPRSWEAGPALDARPSREPCAAPPR